MIHRDMNDVFVSQAIIMHLRFRFHSTLVCGGEHVWLLLAPTAALSVAALYSNESQHFHSSYKTRWSLQQLCVHSSYWPSKPEMLWTAALFSG